MLERCWRVGLELCAHSGDFLALRSTLFLVHGAPPGLDRAAVTRELTRCMLFAECYSPEADPTGALRTLTDVALKALSPAINDPARAVTALDHGGPAGAAGPAGPGARRARGGRAAPLPGPLLGDYVSAGTDEIRHYAADSMQLLRRLRALYERLAWRCDADQREALTVRLEAMDRHASGHWTQALDLALVRRPDAQGLGSELGTDLS